MENYTQDDVEKIKGLDEFLKKFLDYVEDEYYVSKMRIVDVQFDFENKIMVFLAEKSEWKKNSGNSGIELRSVLGYFMEGGKSGKDEFWPYQDMCSWQYDEPKKRLKSLRYFEIKEGKLVVVAETYDEWTRNVRNWSSFRIKD